MSLFLPSRKLKHYNVSTYSLILSCTWRDHRVDIMLTHNESSSKNEITTNSTSVFFERDQMYEEVISTYLSDSITETKRARSAKAWHGAQAVWWKLKFSLDLASCCCFWGGSMVVWWFLCSFASVFGEVGFLSDERRTGHLVMSISSWVRVLLVLVLYERSKISYLTNRRTKLRNQVDLFGWCCRSWHDCAEVSKKVRRYLARIVRRGWDWNDSHGMDCKYWFADAFVSRTHKQTRFVRTRTPFLSIAKRTWFARTQGDGIELDTYTPYSIKIKFLVIWYIPGSRTRLIFGTYLVILHVPETGFSFRLWRWESNLGCRCELEIFDLKRLCGENWSSQATMLMPNNHIQNPEAQKQHSFVLCEVTTSSILHFNRQLTCVFGRSLCP